MRHKTHFRLKLADWISLALGDDTALKRRDFWFGFWDLSPVEWSIMVHTSHFAVQVLLHDIYRDLYGVQRIGTISYD